MNVIEVPAQTLLAEAAMVTLTGRLGLTVMVNVFDVAGFPVAHASLEVTTHITLSFSAGVYEYVGLSVVASMSFTFHWYDGASPAFVGVAVNVTVVPAQTLLAEADIETLTSGISAGSSITTSTSYVQPLASLTITV